MYSFLIVAKNFSPYEMCQNFSPWSMSENSWLKDILPLDPKHVQYSSSDTAKLGQHYQMTNVVLHAWSVMQSSVYTCSPDYLRPANLKAECSPLIEREKPAAASLKVLA